MTYAEDPTFEELVNKAATMFDEAAKATWEAQIEQEKAATPLSER